MQTRPTGVTLLSILCFVDSAVLIGIALLAGPPSRSIVALLVGAILAAVMGVGLWTLKHWAYILLMVAAVGGVINSGMALLDGPSTAELLGNVLGLGLFVAAILYLWMSTVRSAFR